MIWSARPCLLCLVHYYKGSMRVISVRLRSLVSSCITTKTVTVCVRLLLPTRRRDSPPSAQYTLVAETVQFACDTVYRKRIFFM